MNLKRAGTVFLIILFAALLPSVALADHGGSHGFVLQIEGEIVVEPDEFVDAIVAIDADVIIEGSVEETLILIDSRTLVNGAVDGDIVAIGGTLELGPNAVVAGDVAYNDTRYVADPGAVVQGEVRTDIGAGTGRDVVRGFAWFSFVAWAGTSVLMLLIGLVFAGIGGRQLWSSANLVTQRPLQSLLAAFVLWLVLGTAAALLAISVIGLPVALVIVIVLAALWGLGYIVVATRLGAALVRRQAQEQDDQRPYLQTVVGVLALQLLAFFPVIVTFIFAYAWDADVDTWTPLNALLVFLYWAATVAIWFIGVLGAGALTYYAWRSWQRRPATQQPAVSPG